MATSATSVNTYNPATGAPIAVTQDASGRYIQHIVVSSPWITYQDDVSASVSYFGFALPGTATSAPSWRIMKKNVVSTVTSYTYANGSTDFVNIWDNRASLSYS